LNRLDPQRIALLGVLLFSIVFSAGAVGLGVGTPHHPRPGFMPLLIGIFMGVVTLFALVHNIWSPEVGVEKTETMISWNQLKKPLQIYLALIAYGLLLEYLGFLASTSLLMIFLFKGIEPQKWGTAILLTVTTVFISYLVFVIWLGCQFPTLLR
jgi:hypothetical protein